MNELKKYIGKVVAVRGIGSGVSAGILIALEGTTAILTDAYFLCNWKYTNAYGAMHSLSTGDLIGGEITKVKDDMIITDVANIVICPDDLLDKCKKYAC
jgi:hypothetical protein